MSRDRESVSLPWPPDDHAELRDFPSRSFSSERELFRVTQIGYGPWWFGSSMKGRFDLAEPDGTCYLAADALAALIEIVGPESANGIVAADLLRKRRLLRVHLPGKMSLADTTSRQAGRFGVTLELSTVIPYDRPHAWAAKLREAGSAGIVYWLPHDNSRVEGFAFFGPHGEADWPWEDDQPQGITPEMIMRLRQDFGIEVEETPRLDQLRILAG